MTKAWEQLTERISSGQAISVPDPNRKVPQQAFHASNTEREQPRNQAPPRRIIPAPELLPAVEEEETSGPEFADRDPEFHTIFPRLILNLGSKYLHWTADFVSDGERIGTCLGCSWEFNREQVQFITEEAQVTPGHHRCTWAFMKYNFPASWATIHEDPDFFDESDISSLSSSSGSSSGENSESEEETSAAPAAVPSEAAATPAITA